MNVFHEESGALRASLVLSEQGASLQVESPHGKRGKIKATEVLLKFEQPSAGELMQSAQALLSSVDVDLLWSFSPQDQDFGFEQIAREYFGHLPTPVESAAVALALHAAPMYFYKKGRGRYKPATPENLNAAKTGLERKRREEAEREAWVNALVAGECPEPILALWRQGLFRPDRQTPVVKALEAAAHKLQLSPARLMAHCGVLSSPEMYFKERFIFENFGPAVSRVGDFLNPAELPRATVGAFSIDDHTTTEIDDAFSVERLTNGDYRVGIHIAAPALGFQPDSALDRFARERMTTVYMPGDKYTMLPEAAIEAFTLMEGRACPALSLYLTVGAEDYCIRSEDTRIEEVMIDRNVRHQDIEHGLTEEALQAGRVHGIPYSEELTFLWHLANARMAARGHVEKSPPPIDYNFYVDQGRVEIVPRVRGNPIDRIVSELMIHTNQAWGGYLKAHGLTGIYRARVQQKTSLGIEALPHDALGVEQYAWSSSPLRRYVDLINQWQLIAGLRGEASFWANDPESLLGIARAFESIYDTANEFQRQMERYWSLVWLRQEGIQETTATVVREGLGRVQGTPLVLKLHGVEGAEVGARFRVRLGPTDLWELTGSLQVLGEA